jgi:hypothetical protein
LFAKEFVSAMKLDFGLLALLTTVRDRRSTFMWLID